MSGKILLKILKNLAFLVVGLGLLYLAFEGQDLDQLWHDLQEANYLYVFISIFFGFAAYWSRGARWLILLEPMGYKPRLSSAVYSVIIGYFANLAIPRIGEITRCTAMSQAEDIPVDKLFGNVILERIIDLVMLLSITLITILLKIDQFGGFFLDLISANKDRYPALINTLVVLTILGVAGLILLYLLRSRLNNFAFAQKVRGFFLGIKEGLLSIRKIRNRRGFFFHTFFIWFSYYIMTWVVFYSIEDTAGLTMIDGLFILVVGGFGMAAPVQGGIGAYHFLVSRALVVLGVASIPALSFATILHTSQTLSMLVFGSLSLALLYFNRRNKPEKSVSVS